MYDLEVVDLNLWRRLKKYVSLFFKTLNFISSYELWPFTLVSVQIICAIFKLKLFNIDTVISLRNKPPDNTKRDNGWFIRFTKFLIFLQSGLKYRNIECPSLLIACEVFVELIFILFNYCYKIVINFKWQKHNLK